MLLRDKFTDCEGMKFHDGGGGMVGYPHHNLMDMYPGPAINPMDWKNTSQVSKNLNRSLVYSCKKRRGSKPKSVS